MNILLTNDDGIQAIGLRALYHALIDAGHHVDCVAPISEMSAVGHALTISSPLRVKTFNGNKFHGLGVSGTPTDCVKLGLSKLVDAEPDLVVSGINAGANCGVDLLYSGTVSAATEGALMNFPALAVSHDNFNPQDMAEHARYVVRFIEAFDWSTLPSRRVLNLNLPDVPVDRIKGLKVCRHTRAPYRDWYDERRDPRNRPYYWLDGEIPKEDLSCDVDRALVTEGYATLTPIRFDFNDYETLEAIKGFTL